MKEMPGAATRVSLMVKKTNPFGVMPMIFHSMNEIHRTGGQCASADFRFGHA
jgi:hypothetical protein